MAVAFKKCNRQSKLHCDVIDKRKNHALCVLSVDATHGNLMFEKEIDACRHNNQNIEPSKL
ncbi:CLUMA_CG009476, isoform A [Clunio marinus]|uniref:CLUMA_CG009476, isoform A n=1 Tax=Clunio marinus TaxID=568069 RepID=A0A1J1I6W0_9DIPT|nr:CLUMA_CG009476, isoform A [Clunio marinus]